MPSPEEIEERKRRIAEEKAERERARREAAAEHEREKREAEKRRDAKPAVDPVVSESIAWRDNAARERWRAGYLEECARRNPDEALEQRFRAEHAAMFEEQLDAWIRFFTTQERGTEEERRAAATAFAHGWSQKEAVLRTLGATPVSSGRLRNSLDELARSTDAARGTGAASAPAPAQAEGAWKRYRATVEAVRAAFPDRAGLLFAEIARRAWPREDFFSRAHCHLCHFPESACGGGLAIASHDGTNPAWFGPRAKVEARMAERAFFRVCAPCVAVSIGALDAHGSIAPEPERARADIARAVREFVPEDERDATLADVDRWFAPRPTAPGGTEGPEVYRVSGGQVLSPAEQAAREPATVAFLFEPSGSYCSVCYGGAELHLRTPGSVQICRRCLARARDLFERPVIRRTKR